MKIICAGLWKTGTTSLAEAMRALGYKVYDFDEQWLYFMKEWEDIFLHDKIPDFKSMFQNVDALVDSPANVVFEEILKAFPDARVILTVRDDEDVWLPSIKLHLKIVNDMWIRRYCNFSRSFRSLHGITLDIMNSLFGSNDPNATFIHRQRYRWHNDRVKAVVPPEKLLVFNCKEGWKPLCDFLGKEVPQDLPFPHRNRKGVQSGKSFFTETEFGRKITGEIRQGQAQTFMAILSLLVVSFAVLFYAMT